MYIKYVYQFLNISMSQESYFHQFMTFKRP